jgi:hypothetical protein
VTLDPRKQGSLAIVVRRTTNSGVTGAEHSSGAVAAEPEPRKGDLQTLRPRALLSRLVPATILALAATFPMVPLPATLRPPPPVAAAEVSRYQPDIPITATFIYLWQRNMLHDGRWRYWEDGTPPGQGPPVEWNSRFLPDIDPTTFDPESELYSGQDEGALRWIVQQLTRARMDAAISSWWGRGHVTDSATQLLMNIVEADDSANPLLRIAIYYELDGGANPTRNRIRRDLQYISDRFASRPSYLRLDDRPVLFVYSSDHDRLDYPRRWLIARRMGFYTVLRVFGYGLYRFTSHQPDAWHDYRPAVRTTATRDAISVSPGFFKATEAAPRLRRNPQAFAAASRAALIRAHIRGHEFVLWTTGNEDGEGTGYFPATRWIRVDGRRVADPRGPRSDLELLLLSGVLPPLPEIVDQF